MFETLTSIVTDGGACCCKPYDSAVNVSLALSVARRMSLGERCCAATAVVCKCAFSIVNCLLVVCTEDADVQKFVVAKERCA